MARSTAMNLDLMTAWRSDCDSKGHCVTIACALVLSDGKQCGAASILDTVRSRLESTGNMKRGGAWAGGIPLALNKVGVKTMLLISPMDLTVSVVHKALKRYNKVNPRKQLAAICRVLWSGKRQGHAVYVDEQGPVNGKRASKVEVVNIVSRNGSGAVESREALRQFEALVEDERMKKNERTEKFNEWRERTRGW